MTLNDGGDAAFASVLEQPQFPLGKNAGVYRWDSARELLSSVVVPGVTSAPGGGAFAGAYGAGIANDGTLAFGGIINTAAGISGSLGMGVFGATRNGAISTVAAPGTPAPGGGVFDFAGFPNIGGAGDIGFDGHLRGSPCLTPYSQNVQILCLDGAYVKRHAGGGLERIAGAGDPAPGGGFFSSARSPLVNSHGDVVFAGDLSQPPFLLRDIGLFRSSGGSLAAVVRPGDALPQGGHLVTAGPQPPQFSFNDGGEVAFTATLDSSNAAGVPDTGVYIWTAADGLRVIARTGTVVPGLGVIAHINSPSHVGSRTPMGGAVLNSAGHVLFTATLTDGLAVLLVAQRVHDATANLQPSIFTLSPSYATAGSGPLTLTIRGGGLMSTSTVMFNGIAHAASLTSGGDLTITLSASDLASAGTVPVVVINPSPGGGASAPASFTVTPPASSAFTGHWGGAWASSVYVGLVGGALTGNFTQNGSSLTGTVSFTGSFCFTGGSLVGTVSGSTASASINVGGGQTVSVNQTVNASELSISGTYTLQGGVCAPGGDTGTFTLTRLP